MSYKIVLNDYIKSLFFQGMYKKRIENKGSETLNVYKFTCIIEENPILRLTVYSVNGSFEELLRSIY